MKIKKELVLFLFALVAMACLVMGAAATRNRYVGTFVGDGSSVTNLGVANVGGGLGTASYSNSTAFMRRAVADTNTSGDVTLEATSDFLQFRANGSATGFRFYDFYNGGSTFQMRRKSDNGQTVLGTMFVVTNDMFAFGVPVAVSSNAVSAWPVAPNNAGDAVFVNSNGVVYLLTSGNTAAWSATNKIAP